MRKFLLFFAACAAIIGARAAEVGDLFTSDDMRYRVQSIDPPVAVLVGPEGMSAYYEGDITVPATVTHDNVTYGVTLDSRPDFHNFDRVTSVTFSPEYSGSLWFSINSSALEKLTLPKKADPKASQIIISCRCPFHDITMDYEGDNIVLNPKKLEIHQWDGEKAAYALAPTDGLEAPVIYPDARQRIIVPEKEAFKYGLAYCYSHNGYYITLRILTGNSTPDQSADLRLFIPEDYSGVTATDGLLDYSIVGGKAVAKGFTEGKESLEDLTIPESIKYEGKNIPVTKIGYMAFSGTYLKNVNLGKVEEISSCGLYGNMYLKELYLPATLRKAGLHAFYNISRCIIDPAAKIESDGAFTGPMIFINSLQIEGETATLRMHCGIYKNGKPIGLYLSRKAYDSNSPDIMPDENGTFTIDKDWLMEKPQEGGSYYSGGFEVRTTDPCIEGKLTVLSIAESCWRTSVADPAEHIYIIGDVTAWNEPNNPESGVNRINSFKKPDASNADFYEAYKLPLLDKGSQLYAGNFYLPATEALHSGADVTTQFRFMTALTGWDTPEHVGADTQNFYTVVRELDIYGDNAYMGGLSNWGIYCDETTPITVAVKLSDYYSAIWVKKGHYDVLPSYEWNDALPVFIDKNAGVVEAATEAVDENAPVEWYNLQGMRVAEPAHGVYIRRQGSRTTKVLVR